MQEWYFLQVEVAKSGLSASLLVRHPETNVLFVNFDPQLLTLIRETECMAHLGLDIPHVAKSLKLRQSHYKETYDSMKVTQWFESDKIYKLSWKLNISSRILYNLALIYIHLASSSAQRPFFSRLIKGIYSCFPTPSDTRDFSFSHSHLEKILSSHHQTVV